MKRRGANPLKRATRSSGRAKNVENMKSTIPTQVLTRVGRWPMREVVMMMMEVVVPGGDGTLCRFDYSV
jgi:hypothetical protein